jgi:hypothetical protein
MLVRKLLFEAARRLAQNPEIRQKATDAASTAYRHAAPKVENAGRHISESFRETAGEGSVLDDPVGFAKRFKKRLLPPED